MTEAELATLVADEIVALHVEFEQWFRGVADDLDRVEAVLADDFTFISPRGNVVEVGDLLMGLRAGKGTSNMAIRTDNSTIRWKAEDAILATYEEWHNHSDYTTGRLATVLFTLDESAPGGLLWRHVQETWITPPPTWIVPEPNG